MRRLVAAPLATLAALAAVVVPATAASAHSLDSSTVSVHVNSDDSVDATVSVALGTLDEALGTAWTASTDIVSYADTVDDYLAAHLSLTDANGTELAETFSGESVESVEGITSYSVDVTFNTVNADTSSLELTYDAVIESLPDHEAVVVLTDAAGDVSTAGVVMSKSDSVQIVGDTTGDRAASGMLDMVGFGFHHVLEGADHLLFVVTLLLTAPLVAAGGRWVRRARVRTAAGTVVGTITCFTLGHSVTLMAASLGWVTAPSRLVEVLVALSVLVAALHAWRPLVPRGENVIAAGFGLVHGLAFAGILVDLGLDGTASVPALLAFNVGVELAQLLVVVLVLPSILVFSGSRWATAFRWGMIALALSVAVGWVLERAGIAVSPFTGLVAAAVAHPWMIVCGLTGLSVAAAGAGRWGAPPTAGTAPALVTESAP